MNRPHILILGAGFGGMYVARKLVSLVEKGAIDVTIIDESNYFLFTPLLHEVATGGLSPGSVAEPLREIYAGTDIEVVQGKVDAINLGEQTVQVKHGSYSRILGYDHLVIATGATTNYYDISGAERCCVPLKDLSDASHIRAEIIEAFEQAYISDDPVERSQLLTFTIIGGGATGVELAGEMAEFTRVLHDRYYLACEEPKVVLIHAGVDLLEQFPPSLRKSALKRLENMGVDVRCEHRVTEVTDKSLSMLDCNGNVITLPGNLVVWTAGVKPNIPRFDGDQPHYQGSRLLIDEYGHLEGQEKVYALGDVAASLDKLPMLAQVAVTQSKFISKNIVASLMNDKPKKIRYRSKGSMVSIGQWYALGRLYGINIHGPLTWWLWRTVYLMKFSSLQKRFRIVIECTLDLFYSRDITTFE